MTVSAINGGGSQWYPQAQTPPSRPAMTDTAKLFGLSTSQLNQDLQSGTTLSSLASQDGVSSSSLTSAIESDLQSGAPQGAPAPSGDQLQQLATDIANGTGPAGHDHGGHHHGMNMDSTAQLARLEHEPARPGSAVGHDAVESRLAGRRVEQFAVSAIESDLQSGAP